MSGALLVLPVGEVVIVASFLLAFDNGLELHAAQLADDELRSECIAMSSRIAATQLLRSQILHSLPHVVLPLGLHLQTQGYSEGQKPYFLNHEPCIFQIRLQRYDNIFYSAILICYDLKKTQGL